MRELFAKLSVLTLARLAGAVCMFLGTLAIARGFGPQMLADYATALALTSVTATLMLAGFHAFAPILAAEYRARDDWSLLRGFAGTGQRNTLLVACVLSALAVWAVLAGPAAGDTRLSTILLFAAAAAPGMALVMFNGGVLSGLQHQRAAQLPDTLMRPALSLAAIALIVAIAPAGALSWLLGAIVAMVWIAVFVQAFHLRRVFSRAPEAAPSTEGARWRRMAPSWMTIALVWDYAIELFVLAAALIAAPAQVALLHICFRYRVLAGFGMRSIYAVCQPKIYTSVTQKDDAATDKLIAMTNGLSLAYALAAFVGLALLGQPLLALFGAEYADGLGVLLMVSASFLVRAVFGPAMAVLGIHGAHGAIARVLAASLTIGVSAAMIGYGSFGLMAIAGGYTLANALAAAALWWIARKTTGIDCAAWARIPRLSPPHIPSAT